MALEELTVLAGFTGALAVLLLVLLARRRRRAEARPAWVLVDGSNVMHWHDNRPLLEPVAGVVALLSARGLAPAVVFDANAGWKLEGRYMNDAVLAGRLGLPVAQVLVVPKGTQADPFLLAAARRFSAKVVTNDRFRDWAEAFPEVLQPGFLVRGGWRDGNVWLEKT